MKPEQQIKALAELDGWTWHKSTSPYQQDGWWSSDSRGPFSEREMIYSCDLHKMLRSYDAIIPLIQNQILSESRKSNFIRHLSGSTVVLNFYAVADLFSKSPAQLCEALLRATGKWIE
jgi:23S rRNA U2552 (ribose-2'-O)-methylase RlmE/FtsJ